MATTTWTLANLLSWIAKLSALVLASGLMSAVVVYALTARRAERELRRQKLEALYMHTTNYCTTLGIVYLNYVYAMRGKLSLNQVYDMTKDRGTDNERSFDNVRMLVAIYFPEMQPLLDEVLACRDALSKITREFTEDYKTGHEGTSHIKPLNDALARLSRVEGEFKDAIVKRAHAL